MRFISKLLVCAGMFICLSAQAQDAKDVEKAQAVAEQWLAATDAGKHPSAWTDSAAAFRSAVSSNDWEKAIVGVRTPLGSLKKRTLKSAKFTRSLPGAPDGEYVLIQYDSEFANRPAALETIVPMREKDGSWKVSGYFIQ
ncbi:MAG: DUF4019 domain-containing protein [Pseudomonadota bacterium]